MDTTTNHTARADQLVAQLRDARCCDALRPCNSCRVARDEIVVRRHLAGVAG